MAEEKSNGPRSPERAPQRQPAARPVAPQSPKRQPTAGGTGVRWLIITNAAVAVALVAMLALFAFTLDSLMDTLYEMNASLQNQNRVSERLAGRLDSAGGPMPGASGPQTASAIESLEERMAQLQSKIDDRKTSQTSPAEVEKLAGELDTLKHTVDRSRAENRELIARSQRALQSVQAMEERMSRLEAVLLGAPPESVPATESSKRRDTSLQAPLTNARLFVTTRPDDARILILNSKKDFKQGVQLDPGRYQLEVEADGYRTERVWVDLPSGGKKTVVVTLTKP